MPTQIRKVLISAFGDESNVNVVTASIADPAAKEVQVRVMYSGFSGADVNMRRGLYPMQRAAPLTPGYCFVGTVERNGPKSTKFKVGDVVCCLSVYDAEAELANMPEKYIIPVPSGIDPKVATALTLDWNTAYGMVMRAARVTSGQKVFIHGISGAVGWATAVLSSLQGAEVYGTASARNHTAVKAGLPSATPFDYANKDWIQTMKSIGGVDAVFDALGFESWDESYSILTCSGGKLIGYGGNLSSLTGVAPRSAIPSITKLFARNYLKFWDGKNATFYYITRDDSTFEPDLRALFELCASGKIQVPIKRVFEMERIQEAHKSWSQGQGVGSSLVKVATDAS
ncbi:Uncharacterized protein BP5553_05621 [Venustampulla echinocandica]|uniref:Enoyl reductase (ER) domain-containing protein n=1 Tax=Venustampulla echinocandica TaxID=2656787 RepID=A0A370TRR1_9HELO|nr:Uncharacterized protein BP5553_05621 [Venustampulla echinocandica]RDL38188.1 Uncharacterized protein BP5553_05621 [Venustampulla echinocandica]